MSTRQVCWVSCDQVVPSTEIIFGGPRQVDTEFNTLPIDLILAAARPTKLVHGTRYSTTSRIVIANTDDDVVAHGHRDRASGGPWLLRHVERPQGR